MSVCPPGLVFNPNTLRCVKAEGRRGKRLQAVPAFQNTRAPSLERLAVPVYDALPEFAKSLTRSMTQSRLPEIKTQFQLPTFTRRQSQNTNRCPEGKILNPETGKCVKVGGRVQRRLEQRPRDDIEEERNVPILYTRKASKIPVGQRESMRNWISTHCSNSEEPFTGKNLRSMTDNEMSSLIKTSAGTCLRAEYLDHHIRHEREKGREVMDPVAQRKLTLSNMDVLGRVVRRVVPDYRIPQYTRKVGATEKIASRPQTRAFRRLDEPPVSSGVRSVYPSYHSPAVPSTSPTIRTRAVPKTRSLLPQDRGGRSLLPQDRGGRSLLPQDRGGRSGLPNPPPTAYPENWKFFIGKDARSGNDFYSVYYYDKDMATMTEEGVQIPAAAIQIDMGLIPAFVGVVESGTPTCTTSALVEKLIALHKKNKLLHKLGNQLVATLELPAERNRWKTPDGAIQRRFFQQVCEYLDELVA